MGSNERYVRDRVQIKECSDGFVGCPEITPFNWKASDPVLWKRVRKIVEELEEQIRQVEREIWLLDNKIKTFPPAINRAMEGSPLFAADLVREQYVWYRILAARQAALAELQRGMKQAEEGRG
jgi:hypothetical protein